MSFPNPSRATPRRLRLPAVPSRFNSRLWLAALLLLIALLLQPFHSFAANPDASAFIRINQIGYGVTDAKIAVAMAAAPLTETFTVVDAATHQVAFKGTSRPLAGRWGAFNHFVELDFSALSRPGRYFLQVGAAQSPTFSIAADLYAELPDQLLEFMRQQRCGYNPWLDTVCHPFDGRTAFGPLPAGTYLNA